MTEISELEQRITAALERIGRAVEGLSHLPEPPAAPPPAAAPDVARVDPVDLRAAQFEAQAASAEAARLTEALQVERDANAQLTERVRAIRERQDAAVAGLEARLSAMTAQLDAQGIELQRMRMVNVHLRETVRILREAAEAEVTDTHLINKAMQSELESLRVTRTAEVLELDALLAELDPLLIEEPADART